MKNHKLFYLILSIIFLCFLFTPYTLISYGQTNNEHASDNFVKVQLPKGVSLELPKNWLLLSNNQLITLDSAVKSKKVLLEIKKEKSELPFAANYYDDKGNILGIINVRYYPQYKLSQKDAIAATQKEIEELDAVLKNGAIKSSKEYNYKITSWIGTQKETINGITVFLTEYLRSAYTGNGDFRVKLIRVLSGKESFTLTISYHELAASHLKPITEKIINSLNFEGLETVKIIKPKPNNSKPGEKSVQTVNQIPDITIGGMAAHGHLENGWIVYKTYKHGDAFTLHISPDMQRYYNMAVAVALSFRTLSDENSLAGLEARFFLKDYKFLDKVFQDSDKYIIAAYDEYGEKCRQVSSSTRIEDGLYVGGVFSGVPTVIKIWMK